MRIPTWVMQINCEIDNDHDVKQLTSVPYVLTMRASTSVIRRATILV